MTAGGRGRTGTLLRAAAAGLAALVCSLVPAPAEAHAYLDRSNPADGSTLTAAPRTLRLEFSEHVVLRATHIEVVDGDGTVVPVTGLRLVTADPDDTEEPAGIVATLPRLAQNTYRVSWETLSSDDLHRTSGIFVFGVRRVVAAGVVSESLPRPEEAVLRWLVLGGTSLALGGALTRRLARRRLAAVPAATGARLAGLSLAGPAVAALAAVVLLGVQLAPGGLGLRDLLSSSYGPRWAVREAGLLTLVLAALTLRRAPSRSTPPLLVVGALAACTGTALLGHAGAGTSLDLTRVLATTAHLLAATTWAGALACLALLLVRPAWRPGLGAGELRGLLRSFGLPAAACVTVMTVTGVYLASDVVGSVDAALRTFYGRSLLVKLALVSCTGLLAFANHRHARSRHDLDTPRRTVTAEAALALAVVAVTAVLTSGQPATEPALVRSDVVATPGPVAAQVQDLQQSVSLRPNHPGRNVAVVDVFDSRRPAPAQILGVDVGVGTSTPAPATALEDGHWTSGAVDAATGTTSITVVVHRAGVPDVTSRTPWTVGEAPGRTHRALVSTAPVRTELRLLAGLLAAAAAVLWGAVLLGRRRRARRTAAMVSSTAPHAPEPVPSSAGDTR